MKPTQLGFQHRPSTTAEEFQLMPCECSSQQRDIKLSHSCSGEQQGGRNSTAWAIQQRKTACRELFYAVLQMWGVKDTYTPRLCCQMRGDPECIGRTGTGRGVSDMARGSQWPCWELIWASLISSQIPFISLERGKSSWIYYSTQHSSSTTNQTPWFSLVTA